MAVLAVSAAWIWFSRVTDASLQTTILSSPAKGFVAPEFSLYTPAGELVSLNDLRGKAVILNFWASWCTPCRAEMPALEQVHSEYKDQGLVIIGINATNQDNPSSATQFISENGLSFPMLLDVDGSTSQLYRLTALPTTYFINPQGIIQDVVVGGPMAEALLRIRAQKLLEGMR